MTDTLDIPGLRAKLAEAEADARDVAAILAILGQASGLPDGTGSFDVIQAVIKKMAEMEVVQNAVRAENERLREALTAVDGIAWSVPFIESTESEALDKRLFDIRALTKAALATQEPADG